MWDMYRVFLKIKYLNFSFQSLKKMVRASLKLENVETRAGFVEFVSQIGWIGNEFIDFSESLKADNFEFASMDVAKVKMVSEKLGMFDEVIVFLAKKVFNRHPVDTNSGDNIDPAHKKFEMVMRYGASISCFLYFFQLKYALPTFSVFTTTDRSQINLLSFLTTTLAGQNAIELLTTTRWLQVTGLIGQRKLTEFLRTTFFTQAKVHSYPLWADCLSSGITTRPMIRHQIKVNMEKENFSTLLPLISIDLLFPNV
jgi:hypothetical protein